MSLMNPIILNRTAIIAVTIDATDNALSFPYALIIKSNPPPTTNKIIIPIIPPKPTFVKLSIFNSNPINVESDTVKSNTSPTAAILIYTPFLFYFYFPS